MAATSRARRGLATANRRARAVSSGAVARVLASNARRAPSVPGVTVLTVNWNTLEFVRVLVRAVRWFSTPDIRIVVVDNASTDGSVEYLQRCESVDLMRLPLNVGHGAGLDLGMTKVRTEYVAVLDVDAFPVSPNWLERPLRALSGGAQISGAHYTRNYVHPCFLVTRRDLISGYGLTFHPRGTFPTRDSCPLFLDVGEALSQSVAVKFGSKSLDRIEATSIRGPGMVGTVYGDIVYHNYFATQGVHRKEALDYWSEAVEKYLGHCSDEHSSPAE